MRRQHFDALRPICPRCLVGKNEEHALGIGAVLAGTDTDIEHGILNCPNPTCRLEYPIIDGTPILLADVRAHIDGSLLHIIARDDLPEALESIVGDCVGPDAPLNATRQHLSTYAWDHYAEFDPAERSNPRASNAPAPGGVARCLARGLDLLADGVASPVLDIGCSVGRSTLDLAQQADGLVVGVDVNLSMLQLARRVCGSGVVRYPRRRVGIVYDRREFEARFANTDRVDFWACDALALPFSGETFGLAVGLNVLDCLASPVAGLQSVRRVLRPGGSALLSTPYDWSTGVTPVEAWIGGHSQRGPDAGACEPLLRSLLSPGSHPQSIEGLRLTAECADIPWHARLHDRSTVTYSAHLVAAIASR